MRVLVVDDFPGATEATCVVLQLLGHETMQAMTGRDAVAKARAFDPEIVILDLGLPDINGYEVAALLRAMPGGDSFYIVAMTGWDQYRERTAANAASFDQVASKPMDAKVLREIVANGTVDVQRRRLAG